MWDSFFWVVFFFSVSCFDICARFSHCDVITNGYRISSQSCRWPYERPALPNSFPDCRFSFSIRTLLGVVHTVDFFRPHFSVQVESESFFFEIDWNEQPHAILVQQLLKINYRSLTNFNVNRYYEITIVFHVEVLFFVRDLGSTARTLCTSGAAGAVGNADALLPNT